MKLLKSMLLFTMIFCLAVFNLHSGGSEKKAPKNIIFFISDGCGYNHIDAANLYEYGKTGTQVYEQFPVKYAMSTYSADGHGYSPELAWKTFEYVKQKPTDSAASVTALACGVKTYNGRIGVDTAGVPVENVAERAEKLGKSSGVVTSVPLSHATPAGFIAHNQSRRNYLQISQEMILDSKIDVIMGCGHPFFNDDGDSTTDVSFIFVGGEDTWQGLTATTVGNDADGDGIADPWTLIQDQVEFQELMSGSTPKRLIGVPKVRGTLQYLRSDDPNAGPYMVPFNKNIPTLTEMTRAAINVLDEDKDGFFLMVEGGAVDWAGHGNQSGRMIEEEIDFNRAVQSAIDWVNQNSNWNETLIIVTGDHETGYLTGPGSNPADIDIEGSVVQDIWKPLINNGKGNLPGMEWHSGNHTNSLIPLFAKGAGSEKFDFYADESDPVRGKYIDSAELGQLLLSLYK